MQAIDGYGASLASRWRGEGSLARPVRASEPLTLKVMCSNPAKQVPDRQVWPIGVASTPSHARSPASRVGLFDPIVFLSLAIPVFHQPAKPVRATDAA